VNRPPVAVVGVGNMGGALAANLLAQGWPVRVRDIDEAKMQALAAAGAVACGSAADAAAGAAALIVCVVDACQTCEVLFGPGGAGVPAEDAAVMALPAGAGVLLCPTIGPSDVEAISQRLREQGLAPIDAPARATAR
jgi:putative dehydrogenase